MFDIGALKLSRLAAAGLCGLGFSCAGALVFAVGSLHDPLSDALPASERTWRPPTFSLEAPPTSKNASSGEATLARPVFSKSRRPHGKAGDAGESERIVALPAPAGLRLKAIVRVGGKTSIFVVSPSLPEGQWYAVGETLEGWTVKEERSGVVTLSDGQRSTQLEFNYDDALKGEGAPPPPPGVETAPQPPNVLKNRRDHPA
jgi:hypothetical protein